MQRFIKWQVLGMGSTLAIIRAGVTKLLHKSGMPIGELGQWESDQDNRWSASHESRAKNGKNSKRS
jgi:hypothetical protein